MIKLTRPAQPDELRAGKAGWTAALVGAVAQYGSYSRIPSDEKEKLLAFYRTPEIKNALVNSSHSKCAYCECMPAEGGNIEVEHFLPKSIYPCLAFEWLNLLPSCKKCNEHKGVHDSGCEVIVNPYEIDPSDTFYYQDIAMKPAPGVKREIAERTIEVCSLNSSRLLKPRAMILVGLREFSSEIASAVQSYRDADTDRKRSYRLRAIRRSVERIERLAAPTEKYSAFCGAFLKSSDEYQAAISILVESGA